MDVNNIMLIVGIIVLIILIITIPCCSCIPKNNTETFSLANMKQMASAYRNNCNLESQAYLIGADGNVKNEYLHKKANWPVNDLQNFPVGCDEIKHDPSQSLTVNGTNDIMSGTRAEKFTIEQGSANNVLNTISKNTPKGSSSAFLSGVGSRQKNIPTVPQLSVDGKTVNRNGNPNGGWTNNSSNNRAQLMFNGKGVNVSAVDFHIDDSKMGQQGAIDRPIERFGSCANSRLNPLVDLSSIIGITDAPKTVELPDNEFNPSVWECQNGKPSVIK